MTTSSLFKNLAIASLLIAPCFAASKKVAMTNPDFTEGDMIPAGATHDWLLGATGARGWMFSDKMVTTDARQISVTKVDKGSPADGVLAVGDVILGVAGKPFSCDPRTEMGKALTAAEAASGSLALAVWKEGRQQEVTLKLALLGSYSATAPFKCPKSKLILEQGCEALAKKIASPTYREGIIPRSLNALALLASGDPKYLPLVKKEAEWASNFKADSMATWYYGYVVMLLSEYTMATGDQSYMPGLRRIALEAANGQSIVGSWGHKFAGPDGRLVGYGMMNAPGVPLTTSLVLAREAGLKDPEISAAIERSAKLLRFYAGKGAVPYGDHSPWTQTHEDNGKCGMAAVLFNLLGEKDKSEYFSKMSLASHGAERDGGHTGNYWNVMWAMPAVSLSGPHASGAWMKEFGSWYFDLARQWDGTFVHQGPPQMAMDHTKGWDTTGYYLLAYAMPLKKIYLTGKKLAIVPQLDAESAQSVVMDGRGWSNKDRNSAYDALSGDELFERLASWSPIVRERGAMAIARTKQTPIDALVKMLDSPKIEARYGACQALALFKDASAPAVPALTAALDHEDLWLRIEAAEALSAIGQPAMPALPKMLGMIAKGPSEKDPRAMEQRYLSFCIFGQMLKASLDGVDRDQLRKAVAAGLQNQDGRSRGNIGDIYGKLTYEELKSLLPAILEAIKTPSPSGIMFDSQIRLAGLDLFAKHKIKEALPLCIDVMEIEKWGKQNRITSCLKALENYGFAAKSELPRLIQLEKDLKAHGEAKSLQPHLGKIRSLIEKIEKGGPDVELRRMNE